MSTITLQGNRIETIGSLPAVGTTAPSFTVTKTDLSDVRLQDFAGKKIILNIFPSIDTGTCALSVKKFNAEASKLHNTVILCVSADLPFAQKRFCGAEHVDNVIPVSIFRHNEFGKNYGVTITSGPIAGLLSRAIVIIDDQGKVVYTQQVPEIVDEPNYEAALAVL